MALHSLKELHDITADQIRELVQSGYRIDSNIPIHKPNIFYVKLVKEYDVAPGLKFEFVITTAESSDKFTKLFIINSNALDEPIHRQCWHYFRVHDDIYADTEDEAKEEHKKWLAWNLGIPYSDDEIDNPIQAFADKLGACIVQRFMGDKR